MGSDLLRRLAAGLSILAAASVCGGLARAADKPEAANPSPTDILISDPSLLQGVKVETPGKYWIGVVSEPAGDPLRAQLPDLPNGAGLVVQQVVPDSPAAKAGIKVNDILFAAGDKSLAQVSDLSGAIAAGKDAELSIRLLRGGKSMTVTVKPEEQKPSRVNLNELNPDNKALRLFINQLQPDALHPLNVRDLRIATEGGSLMPWAIKHELPDDMSVDIHREGKKPAKITVKKGDRKWEVNEDQLDKLPEDVRHEVEPLLGGGPQRINLNFTEEPKLTALRFPPNEVSLDGAPAAGNDAEILNRLQKNVEAIDQRLAEMKRTINELRAARQHAAEKPNQK
jgi:hypothetical protein